MQFNSSALQSAVSKTAIKFNQHLSNSTFNKKWTLDFVWKWDLLQDCWVKLHLKMYLITHILFRLPLCWRTLTSWKMRISLFYMELQMVRICSTFSCKFSLACIFFHFSFELLCVFCQSKGTLPAQCWAPEPTGEGGSQLLSAIIPRRGPHPERATQHQALPADSSELPTELLETQRPPRYHRGWRGGRWLSSEFYFLSSQQDSLTTVWHLMHYLGSDYQAQEHSSGDQTHQINIYNFWKHWCTVYLITHNYFCCYSVYLFTKFTWDCKDWMATDSARSLQRF